MVIVTRLANGTTDTVKLVGNMIKLEIVIGLDPRLHSKKAVYSVVAPLKVKQSSNSVHFYYICLTIIYSLIFWLVSRIPDGI